MKKLLFLFLIIPLQVFCQFNYQRSWGTYFGGNRFEGYFYEYFNSTSIDNLGNVFLLGNVSKFETTIPNYYSAFTTVGAFQSNITTASTDGVISKFSPSGNLLWSTYLGSDQLDNCRKAYFDSQNNVYITGQHYFSVSNEPTFITLPTTFTTQIDYSTPASKFFLVKFSSTGQLLWGKYTQGRISDLVFDSNDSMYITGTTIYDTGVATAGAFQETFMGNFNNSKVVPYIAKYNAAGTKLWATYYGNTQNLDSDLYLQIDLDSNNNVYVSSKTSTINSNFYATAGCYQNFTDHPNWNKGSFLSKFTTDGARVWSTYVGLSEVPLPGSPSEGIVGYWTAIREMQFYDNALYITGTTKVTTNIATAGSYQQQVNAGDANSEELDCFIMKFDLNGTKIWGTYFGGTGNDVDASIFVKYNKIYFAGRTKSTANIATADGFQTAITPNNSQITLSQVAKDAFIAQFDTDGNLNWSSYFGGDGNADYATLLPLSSSSFYVAGYTNSFTNIATVGSYQQQKNTGSPSSTSNAASNFFLNRFDVNPLNIVNNEFKNLQLVPNPTAGNFLITGTTNFNFNGLIITVNDIQGRTVFSKKVYSGSVLNENINLESTISKGIYLVNIISESKIVKTFKAVVN